MKCGLLGKTLAHSYSPQIHGYFGSYSYTLFEKAPEQLEDFLRNSDFSGINVTIPYKKAVLPYCDELTQTALEMGAVNTILRRSDGSLIGHNTDHYGFLSTLRRMDLRVHGKKVLVLGSGGAAVTAQKVLAQLGAMVVVISRSGENNYQNLHLHSDASVIVNCTPVGMYPHCGTAPVALREFPSLEGVVDMIYNPARTRLLMDAETLGIPCENGLWMLVAQAWESAQWFLGKPLDERLISQVHTALSRSMQNIVLIGMPGAGKTTVGTLLAQKLNRPFVDADPAICEAAGCSIPEIFEIQGEATFRQLETGALQELGKRSGAVIATGGGCVTRPENYAPLHQNATIIWVKRNIDQLPINGRPLSQKSTPAQIYAQRKELYKKFADHIVENNTDAEAAANAILEIIRSEA